MKDEMTVERAIAFAARAHEGQEDKAGEPYILHPLRVMLKQRSPEARMAAVLHDVVEDCRVTLDALRAEGCPEAVIEAVDCLTKRPGESYDAAVARAASNPISRLVKLADLEDNMDPTRLPDPSPLDLSRLERYRKAHAFLTASATQREL